MTYDRATHALARARKDYERAIQAAMEATTERAIHRHTRRARTAEGRIRDAKRDLARIGAELH